MKKLLSTTLIALSVLSLTACDIDVSFTSQETITVTDNEAEKKRISDKMTQVYVNAFKDSLHYFKDDNGICWAMTITDKYKNKERELTDDMLSYFLKFSSVNVVPCDKVGL